MIRDLTSKFGAELAARVLEAVASGLTIVFLARFLEPSDYGTLFLAISVLTVVGFIGQLGLAKSAAKYLTEYQEIDDSQIPHILRYTFYMLLSLLSVVSILTFVLNEQLSNLMGDRQLADLLVLAPLYIIFSGLERYSRTILQGLQSIRQSAFILGLEGVARLLFVVLFSLLGFKIVGALLGYSMAFIVATILGFIYISRYYRKHQHSTSPEQGLARKIFRYNVPLAVTRSASKIDKEIDTLLVGYFLSPIAVSYYAISKQILRFTHLPASALGFTISPVYGQKNSEGDTSSSIDLFEESLTNILLLYLPACAGLIIVSEHVLRHVFGPGYTGATTVLQIMSLFMVLQSVNYITSDALDFVGLADVRAKIRMGTALLNATLNLVFIPRFGVEGAAGVTVISFSIYTSLVAYFMYQKFPIDLTAVSISVFKICAITLVMAMLVYFCSIYISGLPSLIFTVLVGVVIWFILSVASGFIPVPTDIRGVSN